MQQIRILDWYVKIMWHWDWRNDAENSALHYRNTLCLKKDIQIENSYFKLLYFTILLFYSTFNQINAALIVKCFQKHKKCLSNVIVLFVKETEASPVVCGSREEAFKQSLSVNEVLNVWQLGLREFLHLWCSFLSPSPLSLDLLLGSESEERTSSALAWCFILLCVSGRSGDSQQEDLVQGCRRLEQQPLLSNSR